MRGDIAITLATRDDIPAILALQEENLPERGGLLSVRLPHAWFEAVMAHMPIVVARKADRLVGYLVASSLASQAHLPIIQAMLAAYSPPPDAYLYGPICVAESARGRGLPAELFAFQRERQNRRACFTFIRADNAVSLRAHARIGFHEVVQFTHDGIVLVVVAHA